MRSLELGRRSFALGLTASAWQASCEKPMAAPEPPHAPEPSGSNLTREALPPRSLRELLARNRATDPEYGNGLSNHQSMALGALSALGADAARLEAFAAAYATRLRPLRPSAPIASADFRASIGVPSALCELARSFESELSAHGRAGVLRRLLPELAPGIGGAAFHGLIRTAYALGAEDDAELAQALAYFVTVGQPLRALSEARAADERPAQSLLASAAADPRFGSVTAGGLIADAMRAAARQPGFDEVVGKLRTGPGTLDELARAALELYLGTLDFTALHAVTSTHALRVLLPFYAEPELALRYHFQALLAACLTISKRRLRGPSNSASPEWSTLIGSALLRNDDHDVKFVFTCREESTVRDAAAYREAAALRLGLV